jgi:hypothetical protein
VRCELDTGQYPAGIVVSDAEMAAINIKRAEFHGIVLFGGGFGFYHGGHYRQGGPVGIGGIFGLIFVVLVIGWLVPGHLGGLSL